MAALMGNTGKIFAFDIDARRLNSKRSSPSYHGGAIRTHWFTLLELPAQSLRNYTLELG